MGASIVTRWDGTAVPSSAGRLSAGAVPGREAPAPPGRSRTMRSRVPACSTSISVNPCSTTRLASSRSLERSGAGPGGGRRGRRAATGSPGGGDAPEILSRARVDLDHVALVEEQGHLHHRPGFERGRLGAAGGGVSPDARVGAGDGQLDEVRKLDGDRAPVDEEHLDLDVLSQEVAGLAHLVGGECDLLVALGIHEVVAIVAIEVLHPPLVEVNQLELLAGPEGGVDDGAEPEVLELGADEGAALAGLHVLELHDAVRLPVVLDLEPLLELGRRDLHTRPFLAGGRPRPIGGAGAEQAARSTRREYGSRRARGRRLASGPLRAS